MFSLSPEEARIIHDLVGAATSILTTLAVIFGAISGLKRYQHDLKIKSGDLLLEMEKEFRAVLPTCLLIETPSAYSERIAPLLLRIEHRADVSADDLKLQEELDRCLRFFYLCTVLHTDLKIEKAVVARSYYYYASLLLDPEDKPELARYVRKHMRRLTEWLERHKAAFSIYGATGEWREVVKQPRIFATRAK